MTFLGLSPDAWIHLGSLVATVVVGLWGVSVFKAKTELLLEMQRAELQAIREQMGAHEGHDDSRFREVNDQVLKLTANTQRLIGWMESSLYRDGARRRTDD